MANGRPYFLLKARESVDFTPEEARNNLETELKKIQGLLELAGDDEKRANIENRSHAIKKAQVERRLAALENNPERYIALYSLKENINSEILREDENNPDSLEVQTAEASIKIAENGDLNLKVSMLKPFGVNFEVVGEQVQFSPEGMDVDKMRAMVDFMQRHGLVVDTSNLKLENADENTTELFSQVMALKQNEEENLPDSPEVMYAVAGNEETPETKTADDDYEEIAAEVNNDIVNNVDRADDVTPALTSGEEAPEEGEALAETPAEEENAEEEALSPTVAPQPKDKKKKKKEKSKAENQFDAFNNSVSTWMDKNKRKNYSWFEGVSWSGGWKTFTAYSSESSELLRKPMTVDPKSNTIKCNYEFKIYTRVRNGKLEVAYSLPPGKSLTDDQAYIITSALKDAGIKKVEFAGMSDTNDAIMRIACAKRLIVPTKHKINAERYDKMIDAAGKKVDANSPELYRYKRDLAMQMDSLLKAKGIDYKEQKNRNNPDCRRIRWAIGAYELHPFRDLWEDFGLRGAYETKVAEGTPSHPRCKNPENGAAQVVGAKMAVVTLYQMYSENASQSVEYLLDSRCKSLNAKEKAALQSYVTASGLPLDTAVRDMPPKALIAVYHEMVKTQEAIAKVDIEKEYMRILNNNFKLGTQDNPETGAIKECSNRADMQITNMNEELKDCQLPPIFLTKMNPPKHDFSVVREEARRQGLIREGGRRGGAGFRSTRGGYSA
ncbi:MAG: hypothetical protein IJ689_04570 [Alphaproteobacteria bacterium]|nr:hypothetical protein [Alphaproteobacteria bacterium]